MLTQQVSLEEIRDAKRQKEMDRKLSAMFREIIWHILLVILLLWVMAGNQENATFFQTKDLQDRFTGSIDQVKGTSSFWTWLKEEIIPELYYTNNYNNVPGTKYDTKFTNNMYAMRLSPPRLRQLRVKPDTCRIFEPMDLVTRRCTNSYSHHKQDTANHSIAWHRSHRIARAAPGPIETEAFTYYTSGELQGEEYWGRLQRYPGDGYVVSLGDTESEALNVADKLISLNWVDQFTRALFVEFNVWNPNTNYFNMITILFELHNTGGVHYWTTIHNVNLYRYTGAGGLVNMIAEFLLIIFMIILTLREIYYMFKYGREYFHFWNYVMMTILALFYIAFGFYIYRTVLTAEKIEEMMNNRGKFVNFQRLVTANTVFLILIGLCVFLAELLFLHLLRYNKTIAILGATLLSSWNTLLQVGMMFMLIYMAYSGYFLVMYGTKLVYFSSLKESMTTLLTGFLGHLEQFDDLYVIGGVMAKIMLLSFMLIMMALIVNILVVILCDFMAAMQSDPAAQPKDHEVLGHLEMKVLRLFNIKKNRVKNYECKVRPEIQLQERINNLHMIVTAMEDSKLNIITVDLLELIHVVPKQSTAKGLAWKRVYEGRLQKKFTELFRECRRVGDRETYRNWMEVLKSIQQKHPSVKIHQKLLLY